MLVTVASYKGGVGKTTTALHVAAYLYKKYKSVMLIDHDPNRTATEWAARGSALPFPVYSVDREAARQLPRFAHCVIDTAARPGTADLAGLAKGSNLVIIPTLAAAGSLSAAMATAHALTALDVPWRLLLTWVPPRPSKAGAETLAALQSQQTPVFKTWIARSSIYSNAELAGKLASDLPGRRAQAAWEAYRSISKEIP